MKNYEGILISLLDLFLITYFIFPSPVSAFVVINEMMPNPSTGDDWVELYKSDSEEVDISGWQIEDSVGTVKTFSDGTKIASNSSFMQVLVSNRLNKNEDSIRLKDKDSNIVDEKSYNQDPGADVSIGRYPDGSSNWGILMSASPNAANSSYIPSPTPAPTSTPTTTPVPTSVPTSSPTNTPVLSATPKPQSTPTKYISPTIKLTISPSPVQDKLEGEVLGEMKETESTSSDSKKLSGSSHDNSLSIFLLIFSGGLLFIGAAAAIGYKQMKKTRS